jgi:hypothetical protein
MESFALFYGDFCMDLHSVASDVAMKRGNEALNASSHHRYSFFLALNASSHHRYSFFLALNASSPLLFIENTLFNASSLLLFKEIHCLTLHRRYF